MKPSKRLAHRVIEGQAFILETKEKRLHSLNPSASRIWRLLGEGVREEAIVSALCAEFEVDEAKARRDTAAFLSKLKDMRLVEA